MYSGIQNSLYLLNASQSIKGSEQRPSYWLQFEYDDYHTYVNLKTTTYLITAIMVKLEFSIQKPVFGVFDQIRLKLACSDTETS